MFRRNKISGPVEYLIVGLGNPDRKYENTRHNCGWLAADYIAGKLGVSVNKIKFKSFVGECTVGGRRALLMKPTTYMNNSGQAVTEAMRFYKIYLSQRQRRLSAHQDRHRRQARPRLGSGGLGAFQVHRQ